MSNPTNQQSLGSGIATAALISWTFFMVWSLVYMDDILIVIATGAN